MPKRIEYRSTWVYEKDDDGETDVVVIEPAPAASSAPSAALAALALAERPTATGNQISRLASSLYWVRSDAPISALVEDLTPREDLFSVGVVNEDDEAVGLIIRRELFDLLGRPYGRELVEKGRVSSITRYAKSFPPDAHVLSVAEAVTEDMKSALIQYFLLKDAESRFCGVFSTKDMLIHLSDMLRRDVATVRSFQAKVVPERSDLRVKTVEFAGFSRPAKEAGGDYYTFRELPNGSILALIADVSGKGVGASYFTAACAACADVFDFSLGLGAYLSVLNRHLSRRYGDTGCFLTCVALLVDPATGEVRACDMGHSYLYLLRGSSYSAIRLPACPPLGIDEAAVPKVAKFSLERGDTLLAITDGVAEQRGGEGEDYGVERAVSRVRSLQKLADLRETICSDVDAFRGFHPQHDDLTAIAIRRQ